MHAAELWLNHTRAKVAVLQLQPALQRDSASTTFGVSISQTNESSKFPEDDETPERTRKTKSKRGGPKPTGRALEEQKHTPVVARASLLTLPIPELARKANAIRASSIKLAESKKADAEGNVLALTALMPPSCG